MTDAGKGSRRRWPLYFAGAAVVLLMAGGAVATGLVIHSLWASTDTVILTGHDAHSRIKDTGVTLPDSADELFYAYQPQFADYHDTWISFSVDPDACMAAAQELALLGSKAPVFVAGTRSRYAWVNGGPAYHHPELATRHWDLTTVTNGKVFEAKRFFILVDTDTSRIYMSLRAK